MEKQFNHFPACSITINNSRFVLLIVLLSLFSCNREPDYLENALRSSGDNRSELEKVLKHYRQQPENTLRYEAARFLIENMYGKYSYEGDILKHYNRIFILSDSLRNEKEDDRKQQQIKETYKLLNQKYGDISLKKLHRNFDLQILSADFLIQNIDQSFEEWQQVAWYKPNEFHLFCEYILPYRIGNEQVEVYKEKYSRIFSSMKDTISDQVQMMLAINRYLRKEMLLKTDRIFWQYAPDISVSQMELGRRGSCRHIANYTALVMKAAGLPVSVDYATWGNRGGGHEWNVLVGDSNIFPVNVLEDKRLKLTYKPAKIIRKSFKNLHLNHLNISMDEVPPHFIINQDLDVTAQYVKSHTVSVPVIFPWRDKKREYGVICIFDNSKWTPVFWGKIEKDKMIFTDLASDIVYLYGYYDNGKVIPAGHPFLLKEDGSLHFFEPNEQKTQEMILDRKYPLLRNIQDMAWGLRHSVAEGSNDADFKYSTPFFELGEDILSQIADSLVFSPLSYRYVRWRFGDLYAGNLAEVEFYGKKKGEEKEEKLTGKIIYKAEKEDSPHLNAMDGDLETYFSKTRNSEGWIGLDLRKGYYISRIRFCPRSDTNFIMPGDSYELCYWHKNNWVCLGSKKAKEAHIVYLQAPKNALFVLHNLSKGKEERIFSYENGKQVWW